MKPGPYKRTPAPRMHAREREALDRVVANRDKAPKAIRLADELARLATTAKTTTGREWIEALSWSLDDLASSGREVTSVESAEVMAQAIDAANREPEPQGDAKTRRTMEELGYAEADIRDEIERTA